MKKTILAVLLCVIMVMALLPTATFASESESAIQLGTGGIASPVSGTTTTYNYVYFGNNGSPIKWRVLDAAKGNAVGETDSLSDGTTIVANSGAMFLLMENLYDNLKSAYALSLPRGVRRMIPYSYNSNGMQTVLRPAMSAMANNASYFASIEQNSMLQTSMTDSECTVSANGEQTNIISYSDPGVLAGDKMFPLSLNEAYSGSYFPNGNADRIAICDSTPGVWRLRSCSTYHANAIKVAVSGIFELSGGDESGGDHTAEYYMRPAFNLNKAGVLFSSAAAGGKSAAGMDSGLTAVHKSSPTEWKLTLLDNAAGSGRESFDVSTAAVTATTEGGNVNIAYSGAKAGINEYLSAMIVDSSNNVLHYGRLKNIAGDADAGGTQSITIPSGLAAGNYTLKIFNEQYNGDYNTDYSSAFEDVALTVTTPVTFIALTANGSDDASTTALTLRIHPDIDFLGDGDITLSGATLDVLKRLDTPGIFELAITDITVADKGMVTVTISKDGYTLTPTNRSVAVRKYTPSYAVTYNANGGTGTMENGRAPQDAAFTLPVCGFTAPTGRHFKEWAVGNADSATRVAAGGSHTFTAATTVYAVWEANSYNVSYDGNTPTGATGSVSGVPANESCTYDVDFTLGAAPTLDGYTFGGWYKDADCTDANFAGNAGASVRNLTAVNDETVTLYAKWTANTNIAYTVEHYVMDTDGNWSPTATKTKNLNGTSDAELTLSNLKDTTLEVANGIAYSHGEVGGSAATHTTVLPDGSRVIKLYYTRAQHQLTLAKGTGIDSVAGTGQYYFGEDVTINAIVSNDYTWDKWTSSDTSLLAGSTTQVYSFTMSAGDITLTASATPTQYSTSYTVTYNANGGSGTMENGTATDGTAFTLPSCSFTAPAGKRFKEWAIGSVTGTKVAAGGTHSFTASTTVYAVWESIPVDPDPDPIKHKIIKGQDGEWTKGGTGGLGFTADGDYGTFTGVWVDGTALSSDKYTSQSGSTIVTLKAAYLKTLSVGQHTLRINFTDGYAETHFTIKAATDLVIPATGDSSQLVLWLGIALLAAAGLAASLVLTRRKRQNG